VGRAKPRPVFRRVLIANRGEIARRVIRACRALGIETVAVYSEADAAAPHVREADAAFAIGPPPARESYLKAETLLGALRASGADAVHPGYGFLSENAAFARAVAAAGATWIGPPPEAIAQMGDKATARQLMERAGVPVVPGSPVVADEEGALQAARRLGFPLMIKASAGGGGIGMVPCETEAELRKGFASAGARARGAFADGALYLERLVHGARHVEIQIVADCKGGTAHLFERECSVQRRHQKVLEEAPSPAVDEALRLELGAAAVRAARAIGYHNLGTVEFLLGPDRKFYFMEMNTRIQVEHPVTEMTTGVDLVELQLRLAAGAALPFAQSDLMQRGHAIELRIYAEDPAKNFLPSPGTIHKLRWPEASEVRVDTGVIEGSQVTPFYDPLLAKLIIYARDRGQCIAKARAAVGATTIEGLKTNLPVHEVVLDDPAFQRGEITISYLGALMQRQRGR